MEQQNARKIPIPAEIRKEAAKKKFPKKLYVVEVSSSGKLEGFQDYMELENGRTVGIYELTTIQQIKVHTSKALEEI